MSIRSARRLLFAGLFLMAPLPMHVMAPVLAPPAHYAILAGVTVAVAAVEGAGGPVPAIRALFLAYAAAYTLLAWMAARLACALVLARLGDRTRGILVWTALALALAVSLGWPVYRTPLSRTPQSNLLGALS